MTKSKKIATSKFVTSKTMGYLSDFYIEGCNGQTDDKTQEEIHNFMYQWLVENSNGFELPQWAIETAAHYCSLGQEPITALCSAILEVAFCAWCDSQEHPIYDGMPGSDLVFHPVVVV